MKPTLSSLTSKHHELVIIINIFINNEHDTITNNSFFKKYNFF